MTSEEFKRLRELSRLWHGYDEARRQMLDATPPQRLRHIHCEAFEEAIVAHRAAYREFHAAMTNPA